MKSYITVVWIFLASLSVAGQVTPTSHETTFRTAYAKLAYATQAKTVYDAVRADRQLKSPALTEKLRAKELRFEISELTSGNLADIASRPYSDFVTAPDQQESLQVTLDTETFDEKGVRVVSQLAEPHWMPSHASSEDWSTPVGKTLEISGQAGKFTSYVAATVTVRFEGKSRTYRTLWLFGGTDVLAVDLVTGNNILHDFATQSAYPSVLADTSLRATAAVDEWLTANRRFEPACKAGKEDVCCDSTMHCGVVPDDLQSIKPAPTTKSVPKGGL